MELLWRKIQEYFISDINVVYAIENASNKQKSPLKIYYLYLNLGEKKGKISIFSKKLKDNIPLSIELNFPTFDPFGEWLM